MNWLEHEYLVPILIGSGCKTQHCAKKIKKLTGIRPHVFADRFSLSMRWNCLCHRISPLKACFLNDYLNCFADTLDGYQLPVIVVSDSDVENLISSYSDSLESHYLIVKPDKEFVRI